VDVTDEEVSPRGHISATTLSRGVSTENMTIDPITDTAGTEESKGNSPADLLARGKASSPLKQSSNSMSASTIERLEKDRAHSATINSLIVRLTSWESHDHSFVQMFFTVYRSFLSPVVLLEKLIQRYHVPHGVAEQTRHAVQLRVGTALKHWIEQEFDDFNSEMIGRLMEFITTDLPEDNHTHLASRLQAELDQRIVEKQERIHQVDYLPDSLDRSVFVPSARLLLRISPIELSEQLCLLDMSIFRKIHPAEFLGLAWSKESTQHRAFHVCHSLARLNSFSQWVPTTILLLETAELRARMIEKWIHAGTCLLANKNYQSLMGIIAGLNISSCTRLKQSWSLVSTAYKKMFQECEETMSPNQSFKTYRACLSEAFRPLCPYLGVYLSDLTAIDSGNPDKVDGQINLYKHELIHGICSRVRYFQEVNYSFEKDDKLSPLITHLCPLSENHLYNLSLVRERKAFAP